jgi:septum formation protein
LVVPFFPTELRKPPTANRQPLTAKSEKRGARAKADSDTINFPVRLILASASPRRAELLTAAGFAFDIMPADVDETPMRGEDPMQYALRVARDKANRIQAYCRESGTVVLSADTVVVANGEILGKPRDSEDARRMLRLLSGGAHDVHTAVVVRRGGTERSEVVTTRVWFRSLDESEITWYVDSGEPEGKAGAYGIQGRAARFIERIEGSWANVVGLPVATVYRLLHELE